MFHKVLIRLTSKLGEGSDFINTDKEDTVVTWVTIVIFDGLSPQGCGAKHCFNL